MSGSVYQNGLSVSDVIALTLSLTPTGSQPRNFGATLAIGGSGVIDVVQRLRSYSSITAVGNDFSSTSPEYLAALSFFSQSPTPSFLYIGAWAKTAQPGILHGATLSATQQLLTNFTSITTGSTQLTIGGTLKTLSALNFSGAANLNAVAGILNTALASVATCVWNPVYSRFDITTTATGAAATITFASPTGSGVDVTSLLGLASTQGGYLVQGVIAETPAAALAALAAISNDWYMCSFADTSITDSQHEANAALVEALTPVRIYGITTQNTAAISFGTGDLGSFLVSAGYTRTFGQYSSQNPYAIFSFMGRAATINFLGSKTTLTMKFQTEPGTVAELLTESQAAYAAAKGWNIFVTYQNGATILQQGQMFNGGFFDTRQGADWLQNQAQTDLFNALATATTKLPQTDAGVNVLVTTLANTFAEAVRNGFIAPGVWNGPAFGAIVTGQTLNQGYYIYATPVAQQSQASRITRVAPPIQAAVKLAGAIHSASVTIQVNQ